MIALLLFHLRAGARVAIKSFAPLFCAMIAVIILNMYPAAMIANLASGLFRERPALGDIVPFAVLGFALPLWAAPRMVRGGGDWLLHLPLTSSGLRRGATLGLLAVELPLAARSILAGVRTAAVINVGTATLGALIGAGGYGQPILTGIRLDDTRLILEGAVPAALLALLVQWGFSWIERRWIAAK